MLSEKLTNALNEQVNWEMYSSYLYLSMSAYAEGENMMGTANWLYVQAKEEMAHAIHMYQYILDRGAEPALAAIKAPDASFGDIKDILKRYMPMSRKSRNVSITSRHLPCRKTTTPVISLSCGM